MAIEVKEADGGRFLEVSLTGKLVKEDYGHLCAGGGSCHPGAWQNPNVSCNA